MGEEKQLIQFIEKCTNIKPYLKYIEKERHYSENTRLAYENELKKYANFLNQQHLNETSIDKEHARLFLKVLTEQNQKNTTISHAISTIRSYYDYLLKEEKITQNVWSSIKNPKIPKRIPNFLTTMELEKLFANEQLKTPYEIRNRLILELLFATGLRVTELINIKLQDIDQSEKSIRTLGKGKKERIVYYGEYAQEILERYFREARPIFLENQKSDYLLVGHNSLKLTRNRISSILEEEVRKIGLQHHISPHVLRHTFATQLLNNGADIRSVQELLGHENLSTTQIYTHITSEQLRKAYRDNMTRK